MKKKTIRICSAIGFGVFLLLFIGSLVGGHFASIYSNVINMYFGLPMNTIVKTEEGENADTQYWKSDFTHEDGSYDEEALWNYDLAIAQRVAEEGAVLLWNNGGLPMKDKSSVSLFGQGSVHYYYVMEGSAHVDVLDAATLRTAFEAEGYSVNRELWYYYDKSNYRGDYCRRINEAPWSEVVSRCSGSFSAYGDNAVMVLSRAGMEAYDLSTQGSDGLDGSYLDLSQGERDALQGLTELKRAGTFKNLILLINSDHAISFKSILPYLNEIDACLWVGSGGRAAAPAAVALLTGKATPSGKLTDTWVYDNFSAPSSENFGDYSYLNSAGFDLDRDNNEDNYIVYQEGIYIGYRYYETRYEDCVLGQGNASSAAGAKAAALWDYSREVVFPFGYGLSYTTFAFSAFRAEETASGERVSVTVTNTGNVPGKEVVEVYLQRPYTDYDRAHGLEKSAVELAGFAKTKELAPGASETVTIEVDRRSFATYDNSGNGQYILEAGDYYLTAASDAHAAVCNILAAKGHDGEGDAAFTVKRSVDREDREIFRNSPYTGKEISNLFDNIDINRYGAAGENHITYLSRNDWQATYPQTVRLTLTDGMAQDMRQNKTFEEEPDAVTGGHGADNGLSLLMMKDLNYNHEYWDRLLDQMSLEEQVLLCVRGSLSTIPVPSVSAPATLNCDGPMGLTKFYAPGAIAGGMCYPSEVVAASTFHTDLIEEMGRSYGENMLQNGYHVLYAPGVNLHRNAFSARNGEYYSEDCLLSGKMAASIIRGALSKGCVMTLKHFALNDQDFNRVNCGIWADEHTVRELYFKAFEIGVTEGKTLAVMSSYNRLGVTWSGACRNLLTDLLRGEWGFEGFVVSDAWPNYNAYSYLDGLMAGCDLEFTSGTVENLRPWLDSPTVQARVRESSHRILYAIAKGNAMNGLLADSRIVPVTNWWEYAVLALQIVTGVLTALFAGLFAATFFIKKTPHERKKEKNHE